MVHTFIKLSCRQLLSFCSSMHTARLHNKAGDIAHEIIQESENLEYVAAGVEEIQRKGDKEAVPGYKPEGEGDRGNSGYWDEKNEKPIILKGQEVFRLAGLAEDANQT